MQEVNLLELRGSIFATWTMKNRAYFALGTAFLVILQLSASIASNLETALNLIIKHHGDDVKGLSHTLESLEHIVTRLNHEPHNKKYRRIRLLNKTFWEKVGKVDGGIPFMKALGFELKDDDEDGPTFQTRKGAPVKSDLGRALELLHAQGVCKRSGIDRELAGDVSVAREKSETRSKELDISGFNPFATMFSRKSGSRVQERAEEGLAKLAEQQDRLQQRFSGIEDRNVTILLPMLTSHVLTNEPERASIEDCDDETSEQRTMALVAQLWRERITRVDARRFETRAVREMRTLRASKVYPYVLVRVRLPSGIYIQARFNSRETMEDVYQTLRRIISEEAGTVVGSTKENYADVRFELFTAPPTRVLPRDSTSLKDAKVLPPACLIHLRWESIESEGKLWAHKLEARMGKTTDSSVYPRLSYSLRYDVPEALPLKG